MEMTSMEDNLNGRQSQWKMTSRNPYRKQMTPACLASKSCTELGPAQPQLVLTSAKVVICGYQDTKLSENSLLIIPIPISQYIGLSVGLPVPLLSLNVPINIPKRKFTFW